MALTLVEAAKTAAMNGQVLQQSIIELYARSSDILANLPIENISGNALSYDQEDMLPGIAFRGVNEAYTESTGVINPQTEALAIAGGDVDVDMFILKTHGMAKRGQQEAMKVKALAHNISHRFVKGDTSTSAKEFDGLQVRLTGNQLIENTGSATTGAALSLASLDEAIDRVDGPTGLLMNQAMARRLTQASRNTSVGGFITFEQDAFGRRVTMYQGLPIMIADRNGDLFQTLAFNEAAGSGGSTSTSIYVLNMSLGYCQGLQNGGIDVRDLGEQQSGPPVMRTRIEWYVGMALKHPRAAARLRGITNAAVTV